MKLFKKIIKIAGIAILLFIIACFLYIYTTGPALPQGTDEVIAGVLKDPLPEMVQGKTGVAKSQGLDIWYESISPEQPSKGTILLIMGISNDALGWPQKFIRAFTDSGYQVIVYDHRGTGMSDWVKDWNSKSAYSLADMAGDGIAVLDALNIQKAHIAGISMGGMIAQELAIRYPDRVASLTSIMSSGSIEDPELPRISSAIAWKLVRTSLKYGIAGGEENMIRLHLASRIILMGEAKYVLNSQEIAAQVLYNLRKRNGYNPDASKQHQAAVSLSGPRYEQLKALSIPALIIHGNADSFIPVAHGKKCAAIIPGADSLWLNGMGHDLPDLLVDTLSKKMISHFKRQDQ